MLSVPRLRVRAIISILPAVLKDKAIAERKSRIMYEIARLTAENTAKAVKGNYIALSYDDIVNPKPVDTRTGDEIAVDILERLQKE